jgi:LAGLIDADG DNA endonuclease family protein
LASWMERDASPSASFVNRIEALERVYVAGYQVFHRFVVAQGAKSHVCLEELREFFGVGRIYRNRRNDNHKEDMFQFIVGRRNELVDTIIPFFTENPLRTSKREDFERFAQCMEIVQAGRHRTVQGLVEIAEITQSMNHCKSRKDLIRILRGHTPNTPLTG